MGSEGVFRCKYCGAPLEVSPETIVAICNYCGRENWIKGSGRVLIVRPASENEALEKARRLVGESFRNTVKTPLQVFIPYYVATAIADADYEAKTMVTVERCVSKRKGNTTVRECYTRVIPVYVKGYLAGFGNRYSVPARKGVGGKTVEALGKYLLRSEIQLVELASFKFEREKASYRNILAVELDKSDVNELILDQHLDELRKRVIEEIRREARVKASIHGSPVSVSIVWKRITPLNIRIEVSDPILTPAYYVRYGEQGEYKILLSGFDLRELVIEKPVSRIERALWGIAATMSSGLAGGIAARLLMSQTVHQGSFIALSLAIAIMAGGGYGAYYSIRKMFRPVGVSIKV